jgi:hypothetical protein
MATYVKRLVLRIASATVIVIGVAIIGGIRIERTDLKKVRYSELVSESPNCKKRSDDTKRTKAITQRRIKA